MKRFANLALVLLLALALTACGGKEPSGTPAASKSAQGDSAPTSSAPASSAPASSAPAGSGQGDPAGKEAPAPKAGSALVFVYRDCPLPMNAEFAPLLA